VHVLGHPVDLDSVVAIARRFGLAVIEDATEALGAEYRGSRVGSIGDAACLSFNGNKLLTTGGGGMIVTSRADWAHRARYLTTQAKDDPVEYVHGDIGYNYRLTNLLAAMGVAQLEQLEHYVEAKRSIARRYNAALADVPGLSPMKEAPWARSVFWMYTITIDPESFGMGSRDLMKRLAPVAQTRPLWQPLHLSAPHQEAYCVGGAVAESLYRNALSLPCSVGLTAEDQGTVIQQVRAAAAHTCRSAVA
jgi:perosamine synthetase